MISVSRVDDKILAKISEDFRERIKNIPCSVYHVESYVEPIFVNLQSKQPVLDPRAVIQTEIKPTTRAQLIGWFVSLTRFYRLTEETLHTAVFVLDSFLAKQKIERYYFQLLGLACMQIAMKFEEIYPPDLREMLKVSEYKFTRDDVT